MGIPTSIFVHANSVCETMQNQLFLIIRQEIGEFNHIEPKRDPAGHLVNIVGYLTEAG